MESELRAKLEGCEPTGPEYAALLSELAELKLREGDPQAAQTLLEECYAIQKGSIESQDLSADLPSSSGHVKEEGSIAGPGDEAAASSEEDWERDWDSAPVVLPVTAPAPLPARAQQRASSSKPAAAVKGRGGAKFSAAADDAEEEDEWDSSAARQQAAPHIVEIYGLNRAITTTHLEQFLDSYHWGGIPPNVRWVDDEHALAVFPNQQGAAALLEAPQRQFKVRPYADACDAAFTLPSEELAPPRGVRPKTTAAVAARLISHALGNSKIRDKDAEKELSKLRQEKAAEKKAKAVAMAAAWGDD